jgi:hypothetical protein
VVVRARGHLINGDIKLNDFQIPTCQPSLKVAAKKQDGFFVIPIGGDGSDHGTFVAFRCNA